jgi:hypothetical protein
MRNRAVVVRFRHSPLKGLHMIKRSCRFGFILLLTLLFLPGSAVASSGTSEDRGPALAEVLSHWLGLVTGLLGQEGTVPPESSTTDGDLGPGWDPWGRSTLPTDDTPSQSDLGHGWDPWGCRLPTDDPPSQSDLVHGWDPWG